MSLKNHLYIIGNGFDLYHGLMTSYNHFREYVKRNDSELYELIEKYYENKDGDFWYNFEENLARLDDFALREYANNFLEDYSCDSWKDAYHHDYQFEIKNIIDRITEQLYQAFVQWLGCIYVDNACRKAIVLDKDALYLSFNYTLTLEKIYNIPKVNVLHIHGIIDNEQEDNLIYGHGGFSYELDKTIEDPRVYEGEEIIKDYFDKTMKPVKSIIHRYRKFFNREIVNVNRITIIGHSMNDIDYPYFKRIVNSANKNTQFTYYYYSADDIIRCLNTLHYKLKIPSNQLLFFSYPN